MCVCRIILNSTCRREIDTPPSNRAWFYMERSNGEVLTAPSSRDYTKQECIPVGCVPPAQWPSGGGVLHPGGVPCDLSHHAFDVTCMLPAHQLRPTNSAAAYILLVMWPAMYAGIPTPPPPVDRILDTRFSKYYLAPNFVCGREWWTFACFLFWFIILPFYQNGHVTPADISIDEYNSINIVRHNTDQHSC